MEFFDKFSETIMSASKDMSQKARDLSETAKLSLDIRSKEDCVRRLYAEIGEQYYKEHKDDIEPAYEQMEKIKEYMETIENLKKHLQEVKGTKTCDRCGEEIQTGDAYCRKCGAKVEEDDIVVDAEVKDAPVEDESAEEPVQTTDDMVEEE
ncbi:MAG: zinc ribbon domain-containing protein [bacterium]|nr:zinc ribbon domain-containing protein [bacterium]